MDIGKIDSNSVNGYLPAEGGQEPQAGAMGNRTVVMRTSNSVSQIKGVPGLQEGLKLGGIEQGESLDVRDVKQVGGSFLGDAVVLERDFFDWADTVADRVATGAGAQLDSAQRLDVAHALAERLKDSPELKSALFGHGLGDGPGPSAATLHQLFAADEQSCVDDFVGCFRLCKDLPNASDLVSRIVADRKLVSGLAKYEADDGEKACALKALASLYREEVPQEGDGVDRLMTFFSLFLEELRRECEEYTDEQVEKLAQKCDEAEQAANGSNDPGLKRVLKQCKFDLKRAQAARADEQRSHVMGIVVSTLCAVNKKFAATVKNLTKEELDSWKDRIVNLTAESLDVRDTMLLMKSDVSMMENNGFETLAQYHNRSCNYPEGVQTKEDVMRLMNVFRLKSAKLGIERTLLSALYDAAKNAQGD